MATKPKAKPKPKEEPKTVHKFKLSDFAGGQIAGVLCLAAFKDPTLLDPVRKWIAEGKLIFAAGDSNVLDGMLYLASERPTPAIEDESPKAKPATAKPIQSAPTSASQDTSKPIKLPPITGPGWLTEELQFTDGLILPVGCRVVPFSKLSPHKFENGDVNATECCASRIASETGNKPMVSAIAGYLRVLRREALTDKQPANEQKPIMRPAK